MKNIPAIILLFVAGWSPVTTQADDRFLVREGVPEAEIVISESPQRSTRLAAAELQTYLQKISGAKLRIVTEPSGEVPVHVFVGRSSHTDQLGISVEGLRFGAYRIVSGDNWLVLIGDDTDFVPKEPWARNNNDRASGKLQRQWETVSGEPLGVPDGGMYKNRARLPGDLGQPEGAAVQRGETLEIWGYDERGSFNAVCGLLRSLGVRWYLPGELGEVVPQIQDIPLPKIDEVAEPDFEMRQFNVRFGTVSEDTMYWAMRLGIRNPYGMMIAHGMHTMTHPDEIKEQHPDWFALYGGHRDTETGKRLNHLCYSNEQLFEATVRWARAQFDVYDFDAVSVMPPDAYIAICQCELCEGKDVPEMGARGKLSNHVWDFVNRVAKETGKTHPEKKIVCCAYGANTDPPTNIDKLEPNVQVVVVGGRRPRNSLPDQRDTIRKLRAGWMAKTDQPLMIFENYPFTDRGTYLPAFVARTIGESINATKGYSRGEDIWLSIGRDFDTKGIGFNHFQMYFTARMYWGGRRQDVAAMLDEYCRLFYGPAGASMKSFFEYCEANWQAMETDKEKVDRALAMFDAAKSSVDRESIHAKRLALIDDFLEALRSKAVILAQKRGPLPQLRTVWEPKEPIVVDGKLNDQYWRECPTSSRGYLRELQTGRQPTFGTEVMAGWDRSGENLYLAIRCTERPGEPLNVATREDEDPATWYGDVVEIELATDASSYYQIAINPSGAVIDLDRSADKSAWYRWQSHAEVATQVADDSWTIEVRIPVTDDANDPLNQVIGRKPSSSLPWHFNVCRQRVRDTGSEYSAFSPTGTASFHEPTKFAYLYDGRSHQFDVDPTVTDFLIASRDAAALMRSRQLERALEAYLSLAAGDGISDVQKSAALEQAVECARLLKDLEQADRLADQIPIAAIAKAASMQNLLARREESKLMEQFGKEDFQTWPFWQIGAGAAARGTAHHALKQGKEAEADLQLALEYTPDPRTRQSILRTLGLNREDVLDDPAAALESYRMIIRSSTNTGSAPYYEGILGAVRILLQQGNVTEALRTLEGVDVEKMRGTWRHALLLARAETLAAAGREKAALEVYRDILSDDSTEKRHRDAAERGVKSLQVD